MSYKLEYLESVRAVSERLLADIYQVKGSKNYLICLSSITYSGKKQYLTKKQVIASKKRDVPALKNEIRQRMVLDAYN
jgi:hypothetical protein